MATSGSRRDGAPLRIAVANDYPIIVAGLAAMLDRHDELEVVDLAVGPTGSIDAEADVVLYDTYGREGIDQIQLRTLLDGEGVQHVAIYTFSWADPLTASALGLGVSGVLSKALDGDALARHLFEIASGTIVIAPPPYGRVASGTGRNWPGRTFGLSERESEVLVLLAHGLRNAEIARTLFVSEDTVKTHLKRCYQKLGVANRAQATSIVLQHPSFTGTE